MLADDNPRTGPLASQPPARKGGLTAQHRRTRQPAHSQSQSEQPQGGVEKGRGSTKSNNEKSSEVLNLACASEIFREDVYDRKQARKFMWEFFD